MFRRIPALAPFLAVFLIGVFGCIDNSTGPLPDLGPPYNPDLPEAWAPAVTNSFFPLAPGTIWEYRSETDEGIETTVVEVLSGTTKVIQGVTATSVTDRVSMGGELKEDTTDWYAQDEDGNVWYLGEETIEYLEDGSTSTAGSWEWGVDGALPGIVMWADPAAHIGEKYRQEFYKGEAEDWAKVAAVGLNVSVPYDDFTGVLETLDWNAFSPGSKENKFYAPGIGLILEIPKETDERTELISVTLP